MRPGQPRTRSGRHQARSGQPGQPRSLRVVLYEPLGQGGICHYTYALSQALSRRQDCRVTLLTPDPYELEARPREFRVLRLAKASRVRKLLLLGARLWPWSRNTRGGPASLESPGAPVRTAKAQTSRPTAALVRIRLRLGQVGLALRLLMGRADVVHFQWLDQRRDLFLCRLLRRLGIRVVYTAHNVLPHEGVERADPGAFEQVYRNADQIIVHTEGNRRELHSLFGVDLRKIEVIAHGSDVFLLPEGPIGRAEARLRVGLPESGPIVLFFGLIRRYKGLEFLIEAFGQLENRFPRARLAIVGHILKSDRDDHAFYSRLLSDACRRESILCVPEYVAVDRVGLYFLAADAVVLPYTETYQSGVLMLALAAGCPVVVTDTGGLAETVEDGRTGFVVPPRDAAALANAIGRLLDQPEMAARMGREAAEYARKNLSWEPIADRTLELYRRLAGEGLELGLYSRPPGAGEGTELEATPPAGTSTPES